MIPLLADLAADCTKQTILPDLYNGLRNADCSVQIDSFSSIGILVANVVQIILSMAGLVAVGFILYGAFKYIASNGDSSGIKSGKDTIVNAIIGLVIVMAAFGAVRFLSGQF